VTSEHRLLIKVSWCKAGRSRPGRPAARPRPPRSDAAVPVRPASDRRDVQAGLGVSLRVVAGWGSGPSLASRLAAAPR
jgi:hypothetical protein